MSKLSLNLPLLTAGTGNTIFTLAEEPEHEGVGPVDEFRLGESFLDCVITVENDGKFCANSEAEDVAETFGEVGE